MKRVGVAAFAALLVSSYSAATVAQWEAPAQAPETKDRLSPESMDELVARPMTVLRTSGLTAAQKAFETLITEAVKKHGKGSVQEADLLTSFAVALYSEGVDRDDATMERAALTYQEQAVTSYRAAFGARNPEVAVALNSYADIALGLQDKGLRPAAVSALEEALAIRTEALGPDNAETRTTVNQLAHVRDPQATDMDDALRAADEAVSAIATANPASSEVLLASEFSNDGLWKPIGSYNPLVDEFVTDVKGVESGGSASKEAVAVKYHLSVAALDEGIALLHDMQKNAYDDHREAGLRTRALAWLKQSNRAPIALTFAGGIIDQFEDHGCTMADLDLLLQGARDREADLWAIATSCTSSTVFAAAIRRAGQSKPAFLYLGTRWTSGERASELAARDMLLRPEFLAQVDPAQRDRVHAEIARSMLMKLIDLGLLDEALRFGDSLNPAIREMALQPKHQEFRAGINGFVLKESYFADSPAEDFAALLTLAGRPSDARSVLDLIAPLSKRKEARACLEAAKEDCSIGIGGDIPLGVLIVDQLLDDPSGDPYVLMEAATRGYAARGGGITEALCRLLTRPAETKECEIARKTSTSLQEPENLAAEDRALWVAIGEAGAQPFEAARSRYAAMLPHSSEKANTADSSRASVDPASPPFREMPINSKLLSGARPSSAGSAPFAALPKGFNLIRRERSGQRAVAVSISTRFDPNGEVSAGGYWIHISDNGGKSWGRPLYTGLAEHFPYVVSEKSRLPMLAGDRIQLEVGEALIDTASITYPPVGLRIRRKRSGIYLDIPIADLARDSDGDGLTDIAAHHLLLDEKSTRSTPFVVGHDRDCSTPNADAVARLEILKKVFEVEGRALIEAPDKKAIVGDWRRIQPSGKPPIFLLGNPTDWQCVGLDRPMIVYSEDDQKRLRKFSPDFQLIELPPIRWNRAHNRGFVNWSMGWTGGTYRLTRKGEGWNLESISEWIT